MPSRWFEQWLGFWQSWKTAYSCIIIRLKSNWWNYFLHIDLEHKSEIKACCITWLLLRAWAAPLFRLEWRWCLWFEAKQSCSVLLGQKSRLETQQVIWQIAISLVLLSSIQLHSLGPEVLALRNNTFLMDSSARDSQLQNTESTCAASLEDSTLSGKCCFKVLFIREKPDPALFA